MHGVWCRSGRATVPSCIASAAKLMLLVCSADSADTPSLLAFPDRLYDTVGLLTLFSPDFPQSPVLRCPPPCLPSA